MPARPSCNAAFNEPSARSGRAAISSAATKPVKSPRAWSLTAARQPSKPMTAGDGAPPSTSSTGSTRERLLRHPQQRFVERRNAASARAGFAALPIDRRGRCGPGQNFRSAAPRSRRPVPASRRMLGGCAGRSARSAGSPAGTSPRRSATAASSVDHAADQADHRDDVGDAVDRLVSASRIVAASVVKWAASCAGASRSSRARSALVRWANMRPCSSRITISTTCCICTFWKYCASCLHAGYGHDQGRDLI